MKNLKKVLALVLAVVMIMGVVTVASAKTYKDADKEAYKTYADAIDALSSLKILDGFEDGEFKADRTFNRAQAAKIVAIVHNAATNGKIKDQTAISALYSNAQNPFVDCNTSWALPYINYCRITGLADGMTATTYAPKRELTGVQWLKLMLTTLNFDTAKEGYTGTGWDVNVLNRANEVGLTAGLADDWKAIAPIKRGEAAQILYNALTKYLVEYGQLVKNNYDTTAKYYKTAFISNEQVAKSGYTLGAKMGITIERATDDFRRPGYAWSYGSWAAFYMDKPVNTYTTAVTACDILKNDMKVPETKTTAVNLNGLYKGKVTTTGYTQTSKASVLKVDGEFVDGTALNYYAVDGFKYTEKPVVLQHDADKNCQKIRNTNGHWATHEFGGQGDLTQVFKTEDGWVITTIHTFLGEVDSFVGTNKYSHATTAKATAKVWLQRGSEIPTYDESHAYVAVFKGIDTTDFAKGTKVLVTMSFKDTEAANRIGAYGRTNEDEAKNAENVKMDAYVVSTVAAESKIGKLTGASDLFYAETVSIDGTKYNANCRFVLGTNDAMNIKNNGETYTFYFDTYGNVIGRTENTTESSYVVMDKVYAYIDKGIFTIKADLYDLSGNKLDDVTVSNKAGSFKGFGRATNETLPNGSQISIYAEANDPWFTNALYTYTTDDKGVYTLTWVGLDAAQNGYGRAKGMFTHIAKTAYLDVKSTNIGIANNVINLSESTKFVCKGADGTWKSFTGYTALPALTAQYVDYTVESGNTYASIVYLGGVTYEGDSITGYVPTWKAFSWAGNYALITVYVDGEAKVVNVKPEGTLNGTAYNLTAHYEPKPGMYKFTTKVDADGVTYSDVVTAEVNKLAQGIAHVSGSSNDVTAFTVEGNAKAFNLTDVKIYLVKANGTIEAADKTWIDGAYVVVYGEHADNYATTVYVFDSFAELPDGTTRP